MSTLSTPLMMTLPGRYYTDAEVFRAEIQRFFATDWVYIGRSEEIADPGSYVLRELARESIIVARDQSNSLRAFYNVCRHRGTRLCSEPEGSFGGRIQCGYHGWSYALDGRLLGAPNMPAQFCREDYPLNAVHVAEWDGHLFITLDEDPETLVRQLADLPAKFAPWGMGQLRRFRRIVYDVKSNWKLIIQNYSECLHCPFVHPLLNRLTDYLGTVDDIPQPAYNGGAMGFQADAETMSMDGKRRRDCLPGLDESRRKQVWYYVIYPNFLLSLHPDYMMTHRIVPLAVDRTEVVCEWHFDPTEMAKQHFEGDDAVRFWDITNREDWIMCELAQQGISSRAYKPGPYAQNEKLLHEFDKFVLERGQMQNV